MCWLSVLLILAFVLVSTALNVFLYVAGSLDADQRGIQVQSSPAGTTVRGAEQSQHAPAATQSQVSIVSQQQLTAHARYKSPGQAPSGAFAVAFRPVICQEVTCLSCIWPVVVHQYLLGLAVGLEG